MIQHYSAVFFICLLILGDTVAQRVSQGCKIPISAIDKDSPVILQHRFKNGVSPFHVPQELGVEEIKFNAGEGVRLACPDADKNLLVIPNSPLSVYEVIGFCASGSAFTISGTPYAFSDIRCEKDPQSTVKDEGYCGKGRNKKLNIGFSMKRKFYGFIEVCYNQEEHTTVSTKYMLSKAISSRETDVDRSSYFSDSNFGKDLTDKASDVYKCKHQFEHFSILLGSKTQAAKFINCDRRSDFYLARGHLVPNADFVFGYQQRATSYYINTAPQWQTVNAGNWKTLENRIRRFAHNEGVDLTVLTGALNVASLPDVDGQYQELFLTTDRNNNPTIPVPALFWKLVHDRSKNAGIVFLGVNNPFEQDLKSNGYIVCTDICDSTKSWFDGWNRFDIENGYIYCCSINDFRTKTKVNSFTSKVNRILQ